MSGKIADNVQQNNKRIAKNTLFLYLRMLLALVVSLYTSRVILDVLGVIDYGISNVVAGVAVSFVFFSSSLSNAAQRYLSFALGRNDTDEIRKVFNLNLLIYTVIAVIVFVLMLLGGGWLVLHKLVIPAERMDAALWVLLFTSISLCITLAAAVYDSVLIARENMKIYAYFGLFDVFAKLLIVYFLTVSQYDKLVFYSVLTLIVTIIVKVATAVYCMRKYEECTLKFYWDKILFFRMFDFVGWNLIGCAVWMLNEQGVNILLNLFFGPAVNAARGLANHVNGTVNNFVTNFMVAVRPNMIKLYAADEMEAFRNLIIKSSRFSYFLMWFLGLPLILRADYVLSLWLKEVPDYTVVFVQWILIYSLVNVLTNPIWSAVQAVGRLKSFCLWGNCVMIMVFPISLLFLWLGYSPVVPMIVSTLIRVAYVFFAVKMLDRLVGFPFSIYYSDVLLPISKVTLLSVILLYLINTLFNQDFMSLLIMCLFCVVINTLIIAYFGMTANERVKAQTAIREKIKAL